MSNTNKPCNPSPRTLSTQFAPKRAFIFKKFFIFLRTSVHTYADASKKIKTIINLKGVSAGCGGHRALHFRTVLWILCGDWFSLFPFRSPLLRESMLFLFLQVLRCFTSLGCLLHRYLKARGPYIRFGIYTLSRITVSRFRNPRIKGYLLLPEAYRSLSRLSSSSGTKAFTIHPYSLTIFFNNTRIVFERTHFCVLNLLDNYLMFNHRICFYTSV